jgi:glutamate racemase
MNGMNSSLFPLGIFDSGLGGLTVLKALADHPECRGEVVYLGDTARYPYGSKGIETLYSYASQCTRFLLKQGCQTIIVACNTISSNALEIVKNTATGTVIDTVSPLVEKITTVSDSHSKILVLGTRATIQSGEYERRLKSSLPDAELFFVACPLFVPLVEEEFFEGSVTEGVIDHYLHEYRARGITHVVLACTHYPLLVNELKRYFRESVLFLDAATSVATSLFPSKDSLTAAASSMIRPPVDFYVTDAPEKFAHSAHAFLGWEPVHISTCSLW